MGTERTRKEAIKLALYSIRSIYEAVRDGMFSYYYGKKLASRYWEKLNLSEKEIFRYFVENPNIETSVYKKRKSTLGWILGENKEECLYALKYFGFIGKAASPRSKPLKRGK